MVRLTATRFESENFYYPGVTPVKLARLTGFEPVISPVTGECRGPLDHNRAENLGFSKSNRYPPCGE